MEAIEQRRLRDAEHQRLGAGHANDADGVAPVGLDLLLEREHRLLDALCVRQHLLAEFGQPVARRVALHERPPDAPLELQQAALHRRLVDIQRTPGCERAVVARDREQVLEIVPIEHGLGHAFSANRP